MEGSSSNKEDVLGVDGSISIEFPPRKEQGYLVLTVVPSTSGSKSRCTPSSEASLELDIEEEERQYTACHPYE